MVGRASWPDTYGMTIAGGCFSDRHIQLARDVGALSELPMALNSRAFITSVRW